MPVPKQKRSRKRRGDKRKNLALKARSFVICSHCAAQALPHRVCPECGYYKGRKVITIKEKGAKKEEKGKSAKKSRAKKKESDKSKPLSVEELSKQ